MSDIVDDPVSPTLRVVLAAIALLILRWSVYGAVSTVTTKEVEVKSRLQSLTAKTQVALRDNRYAEALVPLEELTLLQPRNHVYWWQRALVLGALHRPQQEVDALEQFVKLSALPDEACPQLGFLYRELGQPAEALDAFRRCTTYAPNDAQLAFYLGHALEAIGQTDEAFTVYRDAAAHSSNSDVVTGLARMLLRKGKPVMAYTTVEPVLALNPNHGDALLVGGIALSRQGKRDDAKVLLERAAARHNDSDVEYALAVIAEVQGRPQEALKRYDSAIRFDPKNLDAVVRRSRLVAGWKK